VTSQLGVRHHQSQDLKKDPFTQYYFAGFGNGVHSTPAAWNSNLAATAAGFLVD
jgi:hypothetical protein